MFKRKLSQILSSILVLVSVIGHGCIEATNPPIVQEIESGVPTDEDLPVDLQQDPDLSVAILSDQFEQTEEDMTRQLDMRPWVDQPSLPTEVTAQLATETTIAGGANRISCLVYDEDGQVIPYDRTWGQPRYDIRPLVGWFWEDEEEGVVNAEMAGTYVVKCLIPGLGIRSEEKVWQVNPALPQQIITTTENRVYRAGEPLQASCEVYDRFGNSIESNETIVWQLDPPQNEVDLSNGDQLTLNLTRAQDYQVTCQHETAPNADVFPASFSITPALPAQLQAYFASGRQVFSIGDVVQVRYEVSDQFDNLLTGIPVELTLSPELTLFGEGNYLAEEAGLFEVTTTVNGETQDNQPLSKTRTFQVEDGPPRITCNAPLLGATTRMADQTVSGQVIDLSDINRFTVNGQSVDLTAEGIFNTQVTPQWGLNIIELIAEDRFGKESIQYCMFFASNSYLSEYVSLTNVALLHLDQDAIDDGSPRSPIDSLGDLLGEMINSDELLNTIDQTLRNLNPIVPTDCWANTFLGCAFSAGVRYDSTSVDGPNSIALSLINGGLSLDATVSDVTLDITASGRVTGISWAQSGTVTVSSARIQAELGISLNGTTPQVTVRGTPTVTIGNITVNLNIGVSVIQSALNAFLNFVFDAFEGIVRNQVASTLQNFIINDVDSILSSALNSLNLDSLGFNLNLPRPLDSGSYSLSLDFALNRLHVNTDRMQIGMKSTVGGLRLNTKPSSGVAVPLGTRLVELSPGFNRDAAGAVHVGLINSILHRLWRGNYFEISQVPESLGQDVSLNLSLLVPPAIELVGFQRGVKLHFGPAVVQIDLPAFLDQEITLNVGGWATSSISINQTNELNFTPLSVTELVLNSPELALSPESLEAIEQVLVDVIQDILDEALNSALPVFPIPEFVLPNSLSAYGIPRGTRLSVGSLSLSNDSSRLIVRGNLR